MREQYIPDLTERFPEGFGGVDLTDKYFPCERGYDYALEEMMCKHYDYNVDEEEEDFRLV